MGFENTLANLPGGLGAFLAQKDYNENVAPRAQLQQAQGLMGILAQAQRQQQMQQATAREDALRGVLSKLPPGATPEMVTQAITPYVGADTLMKTLQGSQDRAATREAAQTNLQATRESRLAELEQRGSQQIEAIQAAAKEKRITQQEADAREKTTREFMARLGASLRPAPQPRSLQLTTDEQGNQFIVNPDGTTRPLTNEGQTMKKSTPAQVAANELKGKGKESLTGLLSSMNDQYNELSKAGVAIDTNQGGLTNLASRIQSSDIGQATGRAFGTTEQTIRDKINQSRPLLMNAIRQASGQSARSLDSNVELQFYLQAASDPKRSIQANRAALEQIDKMYGLGMGITNVDSTEADKLKHEATKGGQTTSGAVSNGWTVKQRP